MEAERRSGEDDGSIGASEQAFLRAVARAPAVDPDGVLRARIHQSLGRFRVLERLGRGAMGVVYAAHDDLLGRAVALKILQERAGAGEDRAHARMLSEAKAAARVSHPAVATIYDVVDADGIAVLVMERALGRTLREILRDRARRPASSGARTQAQVPVDVALRVVAAIARGVHAAHEAGVVHRDLKPENVMLAPSGAVKVLDFGLARAELAIEAPSGANSGVFEASEPRFAGTPGYAAPEQRALGRADARSDQYALGILLHELVTGRRPDEARGDPVALEGVPAPARARLGSLLRRCLAQDPRLRLASCAALADALEGISGALAAPRSPRRVAYAVAVMGIAAVFIGAGGDARIAPAQGSPRPDAPVAAPGTTGAPRDEPGAAPRPSEIVLGCPVLASRGLEGSGDWLGAVAASIACRRARVLLGGSADRVLPPAQLLGFARSPTEDRSLDPFAGTRARSIAAAQSRAHVHLDGLVEVEEGGFRVRLSVVPAQGGAPIGEGEAADPSIVGAVRAAMEEISDRGALPARGELDAEAARWIGLRDPELALVALDWRLSLALSHGVREARERAAPRRAELGPLGAVLAYRSAIILGEPSPAAAPPRVDRATPESFAGSAVAAVLLAPSADGARALADEAAALRAREPSAMGQDTLLAVEAELRLSARDERAREIALAAVERDPANGPWDALVAASYAQRGFVAVGRAMALWTPEATDAYNVQVQDPDLTDEERVAVLRRAYLLAPTAPLYAANYGRALLFAGRREEARAVAARLTGGAAPQRLAGRRLSAEVLASEGRIGASLALLIEALEAQPTIGRVETGDVVMLGLALDFAEMLGRGPAVAALLYRRFVAPDPPRLDPGLSTGARVAHICALAPPDVSARCFAKLDRLLGRGFFTEGLTRDTDAFVEGARLYARRDAAGAARAFRRMAGELGFAQRELVAEAFDRAGDLDAAERIDAPGLRRGLFGGVTMSHVRSAKRAARRGDIEAARRHAARVIEAWALADTEIPAVREMRALLRETR